jgi:hypothetical protein
MKPGDYLYNELVGLEAMWRGGSLPALHDAIVLCHTHEEPPPEWIVLGALNLIIERFNSGGTPGAWGSLKGRFEKDLAHFLRWQTLTLQLQLRGLNRIPERKPGRPRAGEARPYKDALDAAAEVLAASGAAAQREQIEESFLLVQNSRNSGEGRFTLERLHRV